LNLSFLRANTIHARGVAVDEGDEFVPDFFMTSISRYAVVSVFAWFINATGSAQTSPPSMTFELLTTDATCADCTTIFANGAIEASTADNLREFITEFSIPNGALIDLDSPGGSLLGGIELGTAIRDAKLRTSVGMKQPAGDRVCASACAYAFLGGVDRTVHPDAKYGLHQFYGDLRGADAVAVSQSVIGELLNYASTMGVSADAIELASVTAAAEMSWIPAEQRSKLRITTQDFVEGGVVWKTKSGIMSSWQVQATGQVVHFRFACPASAISAREEAELLEKLSNWNVPASWNAWSRDRDYNILNRDFNEKKLGWGRDIQFEVQYFQAPSGITPVKCDIDLGGSNCKAVGQIDQKTPIEFKVSLPDEESPNFFYTFGNARQLGHETNTVRLRSNVPRLDFEEMVERYEPDASLMVRVEPEVFFKEELISRLSSEQLELRLPTYGLAEAGQQLLKHCEIRRPG
jgi:hypothetical protein